MVLELSSTFMREHTQFTFFRTVTVPTTQSIILSHHIRRTQGSGDQGRWRRRFSASDFCDGTTVRMRPVDAGSHHNTSLSRVVEQTRETPGENGANEIKVKTASNVEYFTKPSELHTGVSSWRDRMKDSSWRVDQRMEYRDSQTDLKAEKRLARWKRARRNDMSKSSNKDSSVRNSSSHEREESLEIEEADEPPSNVLMNMRGSR